MFKPLIRTLNGWRFELPLALVLGAATAFATIAMPHRLFGKLPGVAASGFERPIQGLLALLLALIAGFAAHRAMTYPWGVAVARVDEEDEQDELPPIDVAVRLRRADSHPDFPPREPIRASRDLGEPFMDVVGFADGPNAAASARAKPILDGDYVELPAAVPALVEPLQGELPAAAAMPAVEPVVAPAIEDVPVAWDQDADPDAAEPDAPEWPLSGVTPEVAEADEAVAPAEDAPVASIAAVPAEQAPAENVEDHSTIAAFTPEPTIEPTPRPERARRESLAEMMERLSAGLERRAGRPVAPPPVDMLAEVLARPRAATPELRTAIDELNRLAGRRA